MISSIQNEPLWVERYRPQTIDACILPANIKKQFHDIVATGHIPNMILSSGPGTGKTTVAKALCKELGLDWIVINCSEETGIDTLRTRIKDFASTVSMTGAGKCVILDEADYMTHNLQAGLRNALESFSKTCSFVMTCNYPNRIMDALFSRCVHIPFDFKKNDIPALQAAFFKRVLDILDNENVQYDKSAIVALINKFFPDNRRILGQLQQYSRAGIIDAGILMQLQDVSIEQLIKAIKEKSFKEVRQWCADNAGNDTSTVYSKLYRILKDHVATASIPEAILIINEYQRYDGVVPDKELHLAAMAVQMMVNLQWT